MDSPLRCVDFGRFHDTERMRTRVQACEEQFRLSIHKKEIHMSTFDEMKNRTQSSSRRMHSLLSETWKAQAHLAMGRRALYLPRCRRAWLS